MLLEKVQYFRVFTIQLSANNADHFNRVSLIYLDFWFTTNVAGLTFYRGVSMKYKSNAIVQLSIAMLFAQVSFAAEPAMKPILPLSVVWKQNVLPLKKGDTKSLDAKIVSDFDKARQAAGLNANGGKSGKGSGDYRAFLLNATGKAANLTPAKQTDVFNQAVAIWRKSEKADNWSNPPINSKTYGSYPGMKAITERQAITAYRKGDVNLALQKYNSLAQAFNGSPEGASIDLRIVEMHRTQYKKSNNHKEYEKSLIAMGEKYHDEQVLGSTNTAKAKQTAAVIATMHRALVDGSISAGMNVKSGSSMRKPAISIIDNYLVTNIPDSEKERVRAAKGELQFLIPDHVAAAASFASLATESKGEKAKGFWRKAIRSQQILASWPAEAPWDGFSGGKNQAREVLKGMYASISSDGDWSTVSHIGLLNLSLNQEAEAFKLWNATIQKSPKGGHAQHAIGYMASTYIAGKRWQENEDLSRVMLKYNIVGLHKKETFNGRDILGNALLEGGLQKYNAQDYKVAVTKLNEFVQGWRDHKRHDEGFYFLAMSHNSAGNYRVALETMVNFTKSYPKSKYRRDSLVNGGTWSRAMAWEEHVMYFLEAHVAEFPKDSQTLSSLDSLANLYMGREHADAATRIMRIQLAQKSIDIATKADIARRLLDMTERQGSRQGSMDIARMLLKDFKDYPDIAATAYSLMARVSNKNEFAAIDRQIASLSQTERSVIEAQSEVRYLMGESMAKGAFDGEVFSLASRNPMGDLNKAYSKYEQIRLAYESACANPSASWCGPASYKSARMGEQFLKNMEPLDISRTLDQPQIDAFLARKKQIFDTVQGRVMASDEKAEQQAKAGGTNPDWTGAIMWQSESDWQPARVSGETGNGYIQWHAATTGH